MSKNKKSKCWNCGTENDIQGDNEAYVQRCPICGNPMKFVEGLFIDTNRDEVMDGYVCTKPNCKGVIA